MSYSADYLNTRQASITEFNKENWSYAFRGLVREQRIPHSYLRAILDCSEKTLGYYLSPKRPETPKLPQFTRLFQELNSSPGYMLIQKGPRLIDPSSAERVFQAMERMADTSQPSLRICLHFLAHMEEQEIRDLNRLLSYYKQLDAATQEKIRGSLLNLLPG